MWPTSPSRVIRAFANGGGPPLELGFVFLRRPRTFVTRSQILNLSPGPWARASKNWSGPASRTKLAGITPRSPSRRRALSVQPLLSMIGDCCSSRLRRGCQIAALLVRIPDDHLQSGLGVDLEGRVHLQYSLNWRSSVYFSRETILRDDDGRNLRFKDVIRYLLTTCGADAVDDREPFNA